VQGKNDTEETKTKKQIHLVLSFHDFLVLFSHSNWAFFLYTSTSCASELHLSLLMIFRLLIKNKNKRGTEKQQKSAADYIFSVTCPREVLPHSVRLFSKTLKGKQITH
jgi:hypothetical protein